MSKIFYYGREKTLAEAVELLTDPSPWSLGELEVLQSKVERLSELLSKIISDQYNTVEKLNYLAGNNKFEGSKQ